MSIAKVRRNLFDDLSDADPGKSCACHKDRFAAVEGIHTGQIPNTVRQRQHEANQRYLESQVVAGWHAGKRWAKEIADVLELQNSDSDKAASYYFTGFAMAVQSTAEATADEDEDEDEEDEDEEPVANRRS